METVLKRNGGKKMANSELSHQVERSSNAPSVVFRGLSQTGFRPKNFRFYNQILSSKTGLIHNNILNQLCICIWSEKKCSSPCLLSCDPWFSHVLDIFSNLPILVHKAHSKRDLLHPYLVAKMCRVGTKKRYIFLEQFTFTGVVQMFSNLFNFYFSLSI